MENRQLSRNSAQKTYNVVGSYAVQCGLCFKWSNIPTKEEYETIRHSFIEDPWVCSKKQGGSCDNPADLEYDTSRMWIADRPNIPKPPPGFERVLSRRSDFSKFDVYYVTPMGKKLRGPSDVEKFIQENPQYSHRLNPSDFVFSSPKISKEMVRGTPADEEGNTNPNKKLKRS